jgi:hypothetical protein
MLTILDGDDEPICDTAQSATACKYGMFEPKICVIATESRSSNWRNKNNEKEAKNRN